jgi:hypothetical protein
MESPLSFNSSENFRKKLLLRNLPPYKVENEFSTGDVPATNDFLILDYAIIDSPKIEVVGDIQEKILYTKNQYTPENKSYYGDVVQINLNLGIKSNEGEYGYPDSVGSNLETIGDNQEGLLFIKNLYGPTENGKNYGDTVLINNDISIYTNLGKYGYPRTIGSKLENIGDNQETIHIVRNPYKPIGLGQFGNTVWFINDDETILTMGSGEYNIDDTTNSYLFKIGNNQEVFHKLKNLYKPLSPQDYGNTVWYINNDQTILSTGSGIYDINDTTNSYLFQIGNTQEVFHKLKNLYKPLSPQDYGNTVWSINNDQTILSTGSGIYTIDDTFNSYLYQIGNTQEVAHKLKNVYKPSTSQDYGNTVWYINDNQSILTTGNGTYTIDDTFNSYLYQIGNTQEASLIVKNKYSPENSTQYGNSRYDINNVLTLGSNEGNYNFWDTFGSDLETIGSETKVTLIVKNIYRPEGGQSETEVSPFAFIPKPIQPKGNYDYGDTINSDLYQEGKVDRPILIATNQYGPQIIGKDSVIINQNYQVKTNEGEYGFPDTIDSELENVGDVEANDAYIINKYVTGNGKYPILTIDDLEIPNTGLPYANSDNTFIFLPSTYSPASILISSNPSGSDGNLSQDSSLANLAAKQLQKEFKHRVALELLQQTLGRVNILNSQVNPDTGQVSVKPNLDPFNALGILSGQIPIISRNYSITNPDLFLGQAINFAAKLAGTYSPYSYIPGEYFDYPDKKGSAIFNNPLSVIGGAIGGVFRMLQPKNQSASELFVEFTSVATRDLLYDQLRLNNFRPDYKIGNNLLAPQGKYYIGNRKSSITEIVSPDGELPESKIKGIATDRSAVFSYGKIGEEYEGTKISGIYSGLNSRPYFDGLNGVQAGFTWISKAGRGGKNYILPGDFAGPGGEAFKDNSKYKFSDISSVYQPTKSTNYEFTENSILDVTQKLIDAGNRSANKLQHVGNAINQVSKVFNDGYIELTKGSRVVRYTTKTSLPKEDRTPTAKGYEYCRVFTKDRPYYSHDELQKTDGNIRKYNNSVLDNTFNLNIAPWKGNESTNIQGGKVKKYMFSLENLSWRTSNRPGYTYEDLPDCEKGPNGGRIMWFPPYDLNFDESINTNWTDNTFLGRSEPIYTYSNTTRKGNVSWKIIVDHPSIMNVILDRELENLTPESEITKVLDSFFAGCTKYDLYDLVKKFPMFTPNDVFQVMEEIIYPEDIITVTEMLPNEVVDNFVDEDVIPNPPPTIVPSGSTPTPTGTTVVEVTEPPEPEVLKFTESIFFFHNDFPRVKSPTEKTKSSKPYDQTLTAYKELKDKYLSTGGSDGVRNFGKARDKIIKYGDATYVNYTNYILSGSDELKEKYLDSYIDTRKDKINEFFGYIDSEFEEIKKFLTQVCIAIKQGGKVSFTLKASASAVTNVDYNVDLSKRRNDSALQYILSFEYDGVKLKNEYNKTLLINTVSEGETGTILDPKYKFITCGKDFKSDSNEGTVSVNAMACRRVRILEVKHEAPPQVDVEQPPATQTNDNPPNEEVFTEPEENPGSGSTTTSGSPSNNPAGYTTTRQKQDPIVKRTAQPRQDLTKRLARKLLTECNYFELVKQKDPMIYDGLKSKLKHFHPVFHSITPEGLNARLTFLQQCMRPGDTIPTVSKDGENTKLIYNDVTNSVFGAPPICVLRIGDFFHTKIAIDTLSIKYEDAKFDLNPEGIGIQPMIADVSLSFNFIGGHGLAAPIAKLQNALSFNYYANTEMYDERADSTEDVTSQYDAEILADIKDQLGIKDDPTKQRTNDAGDTIGVIKTNSYDLNTQKAYGTISYQDIMKTLAEQTKSYTNTTITNLEKINENSLLGGLLMSTKDRKFTDGLFDYLNGNTTNTANIYGKSESIQNKVDLLVKEAKNDVDDETCPLLPEVQNQNFTNQDIRKIKRQIKKLIDERGTVLLGELEICNSTIVNEELKLINIIDKINFVTSSNDGYIAKNGSVVMYSLSGGTGVDPSSVGVTNTYSELVQDFLKIRSDLNEYYNKLYETKIITSGDTDSYNNTFVFNTLIEPDSSMTTPADNRFFMLFGKDVITDALKFASSVVSPVQNTSSDIQWNSYILNTIGWDFSININTGVYNNNPKTIGLYVDYKRSKDIVDNRFKSFNDNFYKNKYNTYNPYNKEKTRILNYETQNPINPPNDANLKEVWSDQNSQWDKFNLKKTFN